MCGLPALISASHISGPFSQQLPRRALKLPKRLVICAEKQALPQAPGPPNEQQTWQARPGGHPI